MLENNIPEKPKRSFRELKFVIPMALSMLIASCKEKTSKLDSEKINELIESSFRKVEVVDASKLSQAEEIFNKLKNESNEVEVNMGDFTAVVNGNTLKIRYQMYGKPSMRDVGDFGSVNDLSNVYEYTFNQDELLIRWLEEVPDLSFATDLVAKGELSVDKKTGAILYFTASGPGNGISDAEYTLTERGPEHDRPVGGHGQYTIYYQEGMPETFVNERLNVFLEVDQYLESNDSK